MDSNRSLTLIDGLRAQTERGTRTAFWLESLDQPRVEVTYAGLVGAAETMARGLLDHGLSGGGRILLMLPTSVEFVEVFYGCQMAGGAPVPAYPPAGLRQLADLPDNLARMVKGAGVCLVVVPGQLRDALAANGTPDIHGIRIVTPEEIRAAGESAAAALPAPPGPEDIALVQFSSGSTGDPRGICLTQTNVLHNLHAFSARLGVVPGDVSVTWLPLYHDMGLIGTLLGSLFNGISLVLFSPLDFLRKPACWLRAMSRYRATLGVAPQFAYSLCARKADPAELAGEDLSSLRVLLNGAEPIQAAAVAAFEERFAPLGLRRGVVTPCYGLGEATLAVAMRAPGSGAPTLEVDPSQAAGEDKESGVMSVVSVGPPLDGTEVRIRGFDGDWLPEDRIGEITVRSPAVCRGYLHGDRIEPATDAEGWLPTGDLGLLHDGELYVTGRKKDLIIIGGRNLYPQEVEESANEVSGLRSGRIVAFGVPEPSRGTEVLVVIAEENEGQKNQVAEAATQLRQRLLSRFGITPHDVVVIGRGQIPRTSSGKLRRNQTRTDYLHGTLNEVVYRLRHA